MTDEIIQKFISAIEKEAIPNMVTIFFQSLVKVQNKCLVKNQDLINERCELIGRDSVTFLVGTYSIRNNSDYT